MIVTANCPRCGMEVVGNVILSRLRASASFIECPYCIHYKDGPAYARWEDINWSDHPTFDNEGYLVLKHPVPNWPPKISSPIN